MLYEHVVLPAPQMHVLWDIYAEVRGEERVCELTDHAAVLPQDALVQHRNHHLHVPGHLHLQHRGLPCLGYGLHPHYIDILPGLQGDRY